MVIRKRAGVALAALLALSAAGAAFPLYENTSASAEEAQPQAETPLPLTTDNASLFLPASYEEYLPLIEPQSIAINANYIAIADGVYIYVFDRVENRYQQYQHDNSKHTVSKLQFADNGNLYFSDAAAKNLYRLKLEDDTLTSNSKEEIEIPAGVSTFCISGDTLYTISSSLDGRASLSAFSLSDPQPTEAITDTLPSDVKISYENGLLYCVTTDSNANEYTLYVYTINQPSNPNAYHIAQPANAGSLESICAFGGTLYFTTTTGIYSADLNTETVSTLINQDGCRALTSYNGRLYLAVNSSVREITVAGDSAAFTSYEITSASDSENRLSGATDMARAGNLLVTADAGNSRVSVYNFQTQSYSVIPCAEAPSIVATDGETIAYASGTNIYTCAYGDTQFTQADLSSSLLQDISGLACVYGTVYYVTENGMRGSVGGTMVSSTGAPTGLATDLYGNLYVTYSGGTEARKFTEAEFTAAGAEGTGTGVTVPGGATSLEADYQGNLYYLSGGVLYRNGEPFATVSGSDFIWTQDGSAQNAVSFALGFEDDEVYFNFGNYLVKSNAGTLADIPTLSEIAVGGARDETFAHHAEDRLLVTVPAGTVGISTDLTALRDEGGETFPYRSYARAAEERQGVFLAETDGWSLVLFAEGDGTYTAGLYPSSSLAFTDASEYYTASEPTLTRYVSSSVSVYYAPCLESALAQRQLARGTQVTLIGTVQTAEFTYALVEFSDDARTAARGYVPASYLTSIPADLSSGENYTLAYLKSSDEGILFTAADGSERLVTERVQVRLYDNGDGTYTARLADDLSYSATITDDMIDDGNAEVIRIVLIVILTVLALVILGVYLYLLPWEKYRKNKK